MIDAKQAIRSAKSELAGLYEDSEIQDVLLEEVEISEDEKFWNITLGFSVKEPAASDPLKRLGIDSRARFERKYKRFKIDASDGAVKAMTIRNV